MQEHMADLSILSKKYQERVESLEKELQEAKRKFTVVSEAIELLKREGVFDQEKLFEIPLTDRYRGKGMTEAIEDILKLAQPEKLSVDLIYSELVKNGFKSKSKNLKRDLYTRLFRLEEAGKLSSTKKGGVKRYFLPKAEEEKNEEGIKQ
jgi:hypothetical protein